jgi:hypothetical protein
VDGTALTRLRARLDDVRRRHVFGLERDIARSPLWMVLRTRRHPLRRQYRRQRHLLRHGSVVWGYVLVAHDSLFEAPLDQPLLDAPAVVVFDSIGGDILIWLEPRSGSAQPFSTRTQRHLLTGPSWPGSTGAWTAPSARPFPTTCRMAARCVARG